jgi:hypothetical protein
VNLLHVIDSRRSAIGQNITRKNTQFRQWIRENNADTTLLYHINQIIAFRNPFPRPDNDFYTSENSFPDFHQITNPNKREEMLRYGRVHQMGISFN